MVVASQAFCTTPPASSTSSCRPTRRRAAKWPCSRRRAPCANQGRARGRAPVPTCSPEPSHSTFLCRDWKAGRRTTIREEETKIVFETRKIMGDPSIGVSPTTVRVPVLNGHSEALHVQFHRPMRAEEAKALLRSAPGIVLLDGARTRQESTRSQVQITGSDGVHVGRVRDDLAVAGAINLFVVGDNLRKGAALNAVQIAEQIAEHPSKAKALTRGSLQALVAAATPSRAASSERGADRSRQSCDGEGFLQEADAHRRRGASSRFSSGPKPETRRTRAPGIFSPKPRGIAPRRPSSASAPYRRPRDRTGRRPHGPRGRGARFRLPAHEGPCGLEECGAPPRERSLHRPRGGRSGPRTSRRRPLGGTDDSRAASVTQGTCSVTAVPRPD